jgi:hypothetical protein
MCLRSGRSCLRPPIVRDESSRVFLGSALQQSPPLRRPSSMVEQFSVEVNRKDELASRRGPVGAVVKTCLRSSMAAYHLAGVFSAR